MKEGQPEDTKKGANNSEGSSNECVGEKSYVKPPKSKSKKHKHKKEHYEMCNLSSSGNSDVDSNVKLKSKGKKSKRGSQRRLNQKVVVMKAVQTVVRVNLPHLIM